MKLASVGKMQVGIPVDFSVLFIHLFSVSVKKKLFNFFNSTVLENSVVEPSEFREKK